MGAGGGSGRKDPTSGSAAGIPAIDPRRQTGGLEQEAVVQGGQAKLGLFNFAGIPPSLQPNDAADEELADAPDASALDESPQGHRKRLRQRFMQGGPDALPDYELLEMVLFRVFQRGDTKPLAKRLINRFGSFAEVVNAPTEHLKEVQGLGERGVEELKLIRAATVRVMRGEIMQKPILATWNQVLDYCRAAQAFDPEERFRVLFLDKRNQLVADEVQSTGTVDHTPVYIREVVHRALTHRASAVILVHNHPSGDPTPSRADVLMTKAIDEAGRPLGISVHDHIIVGRNGHVSLKAMKLF
jgi:DNA repair protein RadC